MTALRLAHRGDWRVAPENSLAAMRAALANRACDGLEFDVRLSGDGVPILLHDESLARVQGDAHDARDLAAGELAAWGIPTLAEVLAAAGREAFLDIELKEPATDSVLAVIHAARGRADGTLEQAVVSSFDPAIVAGLRAARPGWPVWGNARDLDPRTIAIAGELGCSALSVTWRGIDAAGVRRARDAGLDVAAWTVRRRPTFGRLERLGVIAICAEASALDG